MSTKMASTQYSQRAYGKHTLPEICCQRIPTRTLKLHHSVAQLGRYCACLLSLARGLAISSSSVAPQYCHREYPHDDNPGSYFPPSCQPFRCFIPARKRRCLRNGTECTIGGPTSSVMGCERHRGHKGLMPSMIEGSPQTGNAFPFQRDDPPIRTWDIPMLICQLDGLQEWLIVTRGDD